MATGQGNSPSLEYWKSGLDALKSLGCPFIAIYGAEPLADFEKLPEFVEHATQLGIQMTLITTTLVDNWRRKLATLHQHGLRSLTASYDICSQDSYIMAKSNRALKALDYFRTFPDVDNVAIVITLTRQNYQFLYDTAKTMTALGIWTFFDIYHPDRGQLHSKAKGASQDLLFTPDDIPLLIHELQRLRNDWDHLMVHASDSFLRYLCENPTSILDFSWHCTDHACFPSWITVNCDGIVYPCDDFQHPAIGVPFPEIASAWPLLPSIWKKMTKAHCPGCLWNTHLDAHFIKEGAEDIKNYVHQKA
jgi:MoaA/NifB/PqqE/SkfB family radical SAM enzyme